MSCSSTVNELRYHFPTGFHGGWYILHDSPVKTHKIAADYDLYFDKRGICHVDLDTWNRVHGWRSSKAFVGTLQVNQVDSPAEIASSNNVFWIGGLRSGQGTSTDGKTRINIDHVVYGFLGTDTEYQSREHDISWLQLIYDVQYSHN